MKRVLGEDHHEISPTVGFNIKTFEYRGLNLNLWDVGGQKSIRTYWRNYFEQTDGIIWVVDSVDRWRLEECKSHLRELLTQEVGYTVQLLLLQLTIMTNIYQLELIICIYCFLINVNYDIFLLYINIYIITTIIKTETCWFESVDIRQ